MKNKNNYFNGIASFILSSTLLSIPHCIAAQPINVIHLDNSVSTHVINQNISNSNLPNTNDSTKTNFLDRIFVKPEVVKYAGPVMPTDGPIINRPVNPIEVVKYAGPIMPTDGPAIINQPVMRYAGPEAF